MKTKEPDNIRNGSGSSVNKPAELHDDELTDVSGGTGDLPLIPKPVPSESELGEWEDEIQYRVTPQANPGLNVE